MKINRKGVTLIELLIVLALLSIIITLITSFYIFGARTFSFGQNQHDIQYEIRMASSFITNEIRNSTSFVLVETAAEGGDGFNYIFLKESKIIHRNELGVDTNKTSANISGMIVKLIKLDNKNNLVDLEINATKKTQNYSIETQIFLNNIKNLTAIDDVNKQIIKYKKP